MGLTPVYTEWPGAGKSLPKDVPLAVKQSLDAVTGAVKAS
jgi:hypothetical protein